MRLYHGTEYENRMRANTGLRNIINSLSYLLSSSPVSAGLILLPRPENTSFGYIVSEGITILME